MTQTIGFYCPDCDAKYGRHVCQYGLPCGHKNKRAIFVCAKRYDASGFESVELVGHGLTFRAQGPPDEIEQRIRDPANYANWRPTNRGVRLHFLAAFQNRWLSFKAYEYTGSTISFKAHMDGTVEFLPQPKVAR